MSIFYTYTFSGQSSFEVESASERLSRPRALPSPVPPARSTSVPPPSEDYMSPANGYGSSSGHALRPSSPASSTGSPSTSLPPRGHPRMMSPRYFRPPPGVGPPQPHLRAGPPPPWARGFRPPFDPRFSPRGMPRRPPIRGQGFPPSRPRLPGIHR